MTRPALTVDTATSYLVDRGLVGADAIVARDLEIVDVSRRNQNLKVVRRRGASYLLKQAGEGEPASRATIAREAWFYTFCQSEPAAAPLRRHLPALHGWDAERGLLVLELVDGRPLWSPQAARPDREFSAGTATALGDALGTFHRVFRDAVARGPAWAAELAAAPPWILFAHRPPPEMLTRLSPAGMRVLALVQANASLAAGLDALRDAWTPDTLIHNDVKGDNVLVAAGADADARVRIIDWELVQIGDAAWDVGAVLRDLLNTWLLAVPLSGDLSPEEMLAGARMPLAGVHPAARAFWAAYRAAAGVPADLAGPFLLRALRSAAARLAQGAYEMATGAPEVPNIAIAMLQMAANVLDDPRGASLQLFGLPVPWQRPAQHEQHAPPLG